MLAERSPRAMLAVALLVASTPAVAADLLVSGWSSANVVRCDADEPDACETLVASGNGGLSLAHSVTVGPDGNLYVTSWGNDRVLRYELPSGDFLGVFASGGGLDSPSDCVFGPGGDLFVTSIDTNEVLRYEGTSGDFVEAFVTAGAGGLLRPESLQFGPDGHLYVLSGPQRNVRRYDGATGAFIDEFVASGAGGIDDPHHMFFHSDGRLYVTAFGNDKVFRYDANSGDFVDVFVQDDPDTPDVDESGGLRNAHGHAMGPDGLLYVSSFGTNQVLRYDAKGAFVDVFVPASAGVSAPSDVAFVVTPCPADVDDSGEVDFDDLLRVLAAWGNDGGPEDVDGSGGVDFDDLLRVLAAWGPCAAGPRVRSWAPRPG